MMITGLDGKEYRLTMNKIRNNTTCSGLHSIARDYLEKIFPYDLIYEEVLLPGSKIRGSNRDLYADFFIPTRRLLVEVQGEQHYKFNTFFHKHTINYINSTKKDNNKEQWCSINNIKYLALKYDESDEWEQRISECKGS